MEEVTSRFYVRNLPSNVSDSDFQEYFSSIGKISNVTIKSNYGFFTAHGTSKALNKAIYKYSDAVWNGNVIKLEKSEKANFLDVLAKEREEASKGKCSNGEVQSKSYVKKNKIEKDTDQSTKKKRKIDGDEIEIKNGIPKFQGITQLKETQHKNSDSESISLNQKNCKKNDLQYSETYNSLWEENDSNVETYNDTLNAILGSSKSRVDKKKKNKNEDKTSTQQNNTLAPITKIEKKKRDDERRRESLANREKEKMKQKNIIKSALAELDAPKSRKIVFDSDEDLDNKDSKKQLFDHSNEDEDNFKFPINDRYLGEQGHKLLKLQSQFNNDDRFKMNEKFLDSDDNDSEAGKRIEEKKPKEMIRFDPSQKFDESKTKSSGLSLKKKLEDKSTPIVSKEKFYEVSATMKTALQDKGSGFSLLAAYGDEKGTVNKTAVKGAENEEKIKPVLKKNPFLDESSDEEIEEEPQKIWMPAISIPVGSRDNFFFAENDPLITEGFQFMNKKNSEEAKAASENYDQTRRFLKKIFKDQLLRHAKKNDMFKKKVGGMKKKPKTSINNFKNKASGRKKRNY